MPGLESKLQKKVIDFAEGNGCYVEKTIMANKTGASDIKICYKGRFITIEVKAPGKVPTPLQYYKMECVNKAGGISIWGDSELELKQKLINIFAAIDLQVDFLGRVGYAKQQLLDRG